MDSNTKNVFLKRIGLVILCVIIIIGFLSLTYIYQVNTKDKIIKVERDRNDAYNASTFRNDPTIIQNSFLEDIKNGLNDKNTKSDAYFVLHRFFDNGGNIYEIYDYVSAHPEISFLNSEAEVIYPEIFKQIQTRELPNTAVDRAKYAHLAYLEVLYNHGYADIATLGTIANQYAKIAYFATTYAKEMPKKEGDRRKRFMSRDIKKSLYFINISKNEVKDIIEGKVSNDVIPRDVLVGLNQYAAALRYLMVVGGVKKVADVSPKSGKEIFAFTMDYSRRYVPELHLFTSLLDASTLALIDSNKSEEIKIALYPILDLDLNKIKISERGIITKVLDTKLEKKPQDVEDLNLDLYGKTNTLRLARKVPEFKVWLISNGWVEGDFK